MRAFMDRVLACVRAVSWLRATCTGPFRLRPDRYPRDGHPAGIVTRQWHHRLYRQSRTRDHERHRQRNHHPPI